MANLSQIAQVNIDLKTTGVPAANFSTMMIASPEIFPERVRTYNDIDGVSEDTELSDAAKAVLTEAFAQSPHPAIFKVGRRDVSAFTIGVTGAVSAGISYTVTFGAETETTTGHATAAEVVAALEALIDANLDMPVTSTVSGNNLILTFNVDEMEAPTLTNMEIVSYTTVDTEAGIKADLDLIYAYDSAWYGLKCSQIVEDVIKGAADWTESKGGTESPKIFIFADGDTGTELTDGLLNYMNAQAYDRTITVYDPLWSSQYIGAAWMSLMFTKGPGGDAQQAATWALKTLNSVATTKLSTTVQTAMWAVNGNTYEQYAEGIVLTKNGKVASGEWIDVITGRDWLANRVQQDQVQMMINNDIVPYTNAGIGMHEATLRASLLEGQTRGVIAPDEVDANGNLVPGFQITVPNSVSVSDATKAARQLNISWKARLAGAIHYVVVTGTLSYSI